MYKRKGLSGGTERTRSGKQSRVGPERSPELARVDQESEEEEHDRERDQWRQEVTADQMMFWGRCNS